MPAISPNCFPIVRPAGAVSQYPLLVSDRIILSLFDYSGNWSRPYRDAGYTVIQIDKDLPGGVDVRLYNPPFDSVYGILAAPPCTVFSKAGSWVKRSELE